MKTWNVYPFALLFVAACSGGGDADRAVADIVGDTQILKEAEAAANEVIRNVGDCDAVTRAYSDAMATLDDVADRIETQAGRTTIETLRKQVGTAGEACGAR